MLFRDDLVRAILEGRKTMTRRPFDVKKAKIFLPNMVASDIPVGIQPFASRGIYKIEMNPQGAIRVATPNGWLGIKRNECEWASHYGRIGDRLYVRETWKLAGWDWESTDRKIVYSDGSINWVDVPDDIDVDEDCEWLLREVNRIEKCPKVKIVKDPDGDEDQDHFEFEVADLPWRPSIHMPRWASRILLEITSVKVERIQQISHKEIITEGIEPIPRHEDCGGPDYYWPFRRSWDATYPGSWDRNDWVWVIGFKRVSHLDGTNPGPAVFDEMVWP